MAPIAGALGPQRAQRRGDGTVVADHFDGSRLAGVLRASRPPRRRDGLCELRGVAAVYAVSSSQRFPYRAFLAMHSISTAIPPGSAPAWIVVRAGNGAVKNVRYTSFIAAKSLMSRRYTLHLTTSSSDEPAAWRIARRFSNVRCVSDRTSPSSRFPVCGLVGPCPATKMNSPSTTACE